MKDNKPQEDKHDKDAERRGGKGPAPERELTHKESEKGSGEGVTGMQRGAGHPRGR